VRGREDYAHRRKDAVRDAVDTLMEELDTNQVRAVREPLESR
jgi:hypothetical protein